MNDYSLKPGTVLRSPKRNYTIVKQLGSGGFGITYLVEGVITDDNISFTTRFALKEHFINTMCSRDPLSQRVVVSQPAQQEVERSLRAFVAEAKRLKELGISHPNIVKVNEVFETNGTAYFVMEYLDGGSLADYVKQRGRLSFEEMAAMMEPVCNCVALLHRNSVAHYDIKPQNIMLVNSDGQLRPVLIDFGLAKHYDGQGNATSSIAAAGYTPGYAPVEQYGGFTTFQPTADVYALGATMLFCLTGHAPVRSQELRIADVRDELRNLNLSTSVVNALLPALEYRPDDRPADAAALAAAVFQSAAPSFTPSQSTVKMQPQQQTTAQLNRPAQSPAIDHPASATRPEQPTTARPNWLKPTLIAAGIVLVAIIGYTLLPDGGTTTDIAMADTVRADTVRVETIRVEAPAVVEAPTAEDKPVQQQPQQQQQQQPQQQQPQQQPQQETLTAAQMYQKGRAYFDNKQYTEAVPWFRKAADQGHAAAQNDLGYCYEKGWGVTQSYADAVYWYRKAADQGHATAQNNLGYCYEKGWGVTQSYADAVHWYRKAADQGNARAQCNLGFCYHNGRGVTQSYADAVYWFRKAADQGQMNAQFNLGLYYKNGWGVTQSYADAVRWYRKAADQGHADAQCNLGLCYEKGRGVTQSYADAVYWYRKAADQGQRDAQHNLGLCYEYGKGVAPSKSEALTWYRKAANQGKMNAQFKLGYYYEKGWGVTQSYADAVYWYRKAADQGQMNAQFNLGVYYENGWGGLPQSKSEALTWYRKAAAQGFSNAQEAVQSLESEGYR